MESKSSIFKIFLKVLKKKFKFRHLLLLAIMLTFNSFAWFIYMSKVSSDMSVKVKAWNVSFEFDNQTMTDYVSFNVANIYPGTNDDVQSLNVSNGGEVSAKLSYEVVYASIFGNVFDVASGDITSEELKDKLLNDYPFKVRFNFSNDILDSNGKVEQFIVTTSWPYETIDSTTGKVNDDVDTYWGNLAYDFINNNPDKSCIELKIKISATQIK